MATARQPLTRDRVLTTAVALADDGGIGALSMRRLGQELGVEAMSLYNHVANKDDLLAGILDVVLHEVEVPPDGGDWKDALRRYATSSHGVFRRHPWACNLAMKPSPTRVLPVQIEHMEWRLRTFREAGFSDALTYHALHAIDSHILGFTLWELSHNVTADNVRDLAAQFLTQFPGERYPYLYEHVQQHLTDFGRNQPAFEFVLDLILDGLERLRDGDGPRRAAGRGRGVS